MGSGCGEQGVGQEEAQVLGTARITQEAGIKSWHPQCGSSCAHVPSAARIPAEKRPPESTLGSRPVT